MIRDLPNRNGCEFQTCYIHASSETDSAQWDWGISEDMFSDDIQDRHTSSYKYRMKPPEYSQVATIDVRGPSLTSTPMVRHTGGNVYPESRVEKVLLKETKQQDWENKLEAITSDIVSKTNEVLLNTLSEHDKYAKRPKDLLNEEMAEMRHVFDSIRSSP